MIMLRKFSIRLIINKGNYLLFLLLNMFKKICQKLKLPHESLFKYPHLKHTNFYYIEARHISEGKIQKFS
jgi:hypothetical protein